MSRNNCELLFPGERGARLNELKNKVLEEIKFCHHVSQGVKKSFPQSSTRK